MAIKKQQFLDLIRSLALEAGGKAPGSQGFQSLTGIGKSEWYPKLWLRWGDALREAGLESNSPNRAFDHEFLINRYIELIRELKRFPIVGDLVHKRMQDRSFPNREAFNSLGGKGQRPSRILKYCQTHNGFEDVVPFCQTVVQINDSEIEEGNSIAPVVGYVYLIKHGNRREYKIGRTNNPLRREGEISIELPERIQPIHLIETDDPAGIDNYWHIRFKDKRKGGEWFALTTDDVRAFKRWKRIF